MFDVSLIVCRCVFLGLDSSACHVPEVCSHWRDWIRFCLIASLACLRGHVFVLDLYVVYSVRQLSVSELSVSV